MMKKKRVSEEAQFFYNEEGEEFVRNQILDAYNSGVVDQINGKLEQEYRRETGE